MNFIIKKSFARGAAAMLLVLAGLLVFSQPTSAADGEFVNLSTRGLVGTGDDVGIVGIIIEGGARQVLVQALGPELANKGVSNALADPVLTVIQTHEGEPPRTPVNPPVELMVNDNWEDSQGQLVSDLWGGSPPLTAGSLSAAVVLTLEPGGYTARVEGKNGTVGVANVEVYRIASAAAVSPDRETLTVLYNALDGANWTNNANWLSDEPLGEWYGVTVGDNGRVIGLGLDDNRLSGSMPPELGNLANLELLWLSGNQLSGTIPVELGDLVSLQSLNLDDNLLNGSIPPELGNLANLELLWLSDNQLSGSIPPELGNLANLRLLGLFANQLSGPIPTELGLLTSLEGLVLHVNRLSGVIPPELGNLANLEVLRLVGNQLSGCIPDGLRDVADNDLLALGLSYCGGGSSAPTFATGDTIGDLPTGSWSPDITSGVTSLSSGGNVTLQFNDGGYFEEGGHRYTCHSSGGCVIENRRVTTGTIVQTAQGGGGPGGTGTQSDLAVESVSVSDSSPSSGASFTLSATVRNRGDSLSGSTTLRYYRSSDATISRSDTQVGTDSVSGLSASGTSSESISLTAPSSAGTYYYGACLDSVSGETNTANNCSNAVRVTVTDPPPPSENYTPLEGLRVSAGQVRIGFLVAGGGCIPVNNTTINGVTYTVHSSKWQRRAAASSPWEDVAGTRQNNLCTFSPTSAGEYRLVVDVTINGRRGSYSSENTITVN